MTSNVLNLSIVLFLFLLIFGGAEFLYKRKTSASITRKIVHVGSGIVAALLPIFVDLKTVIILGIGFFLLLVFSKRKNLLNSVHKINNEGIGALLFAPSVTLTAVIFWPTNTLIFQGAALILGLSDGIAGVVGARYGKKKYSITGTKTIEGSLIFFLITVLILFGALYISGTPLVFNNALFLFVGSLLLTIIEATFGGGWDNLFVPITAGSILYFAL
ncbi:MAG: Phosphatidate cytidylyltransferase [Candidatus Nomurabacteria bacterium GW2011_GWF2_43_8]|uniref:Phosphatidate cytidylyltransferase n=3 Tax=Candidatus Nomuraibacteriota TaxID=1752729 RepID=A0A0G1IP27_9BACT|nr:MAG: Phosphatidate cytidylyltransferase [Candidatus Nomurabacteria bacterium GW2011_GWA2_43_15]KKT19951.1 MAG: Phosphatidate cytidylyltransferase [Candidatus Nomurabacteria bacterium GW2011_GWB1_43_7]KKT24944.1 MAG: Phosphatidate cytidylyltransferase [Candidatus Nomurabacteria bacterium GW2011_GWF2_43_8]